MRITFRVDGVPEPKRRPRFARRGKRVITYTTKEDRRHENRIEQAYRNVAGDLPPATGAVVMVVEAIFRRPKTWSQKKCAETLHKTSRPDSDNLGKSALDALNGVAFIDDAQVIRLDARKRYGERDETVISIERI